MTMPTDIEILRRFQENYLLKTLGGDGEPLADHQMASNAITRIIQRIEHLELLSKRSAKCWLYEDKDKQPVFSTTEPDWQTQWRSNGALRLFVQEIALVPGQPPKPYAWMYLEDGEEKFTLDQDLAAKKRYKSLPAVPLYQNLYAY